MGLWWRLRGLQDLLVSLFNGCIIDLVSWSYQCSNSGHCNPRWWRSCRIDRNCSRTVWLVDSSTDLKPAVRCPSQDAWWWWCKTLFSSLAQAWEDGPFFAHLPCSPSPKSVKTDWILQNHITLVFFFSPLPYFSKGLWWCLIQMRDLRISLL